MLEENINYLFVKFNFTKVQIGGVKMGFCYNKLWKKLIDKNMKKKDLQKAISTSPATIARLSKNENVSMDILDRICDYLNCNIGDIVDYVKEDGDV